MPKRKILRAKNRPSWDEYFLKICELVSSRSTCIRRQVGAILVKDKRILATGYNGAPSGLAHCEEVGCLRKELGIASGERAELCRGLHAEQNAIVQAAFHGIRIQGATLYSTTMPCSVCMKMLINAGVELIVYKEGYADTLAKNLVDEAGIRLVKYRRGKK